MTEGWAVAQEAGIHRLAIPTPFAVGRVNVYLIEDEPLTLVDTGPNSGKALDELERQLGALGHRIEDLGLIVVSHQHIDHLGLVDILAKRSGAEVAALDLLVPFIERYPELAAAGDGFAASLMLRHGIPEDVVQALSSVSQAFRAWGGRADVTRPLRDGEMLALRDRKLEVLHRPGHSSTDTIFWDQDRGILLAADHLLAHISSNPLMAPKLDGSGGRDTALLNYLRSLGETREMPVRLALPGHGEPITDHATLIDERFALHERRAEKIRRLIAERPRSGYELAQALWGNVAVTQAYLTLSEIVGHTDLLIDRGQVREVEDGGQIRFEAVS